MLASFFILIIFLVPEVQGQEALDVSITATTSYTRNTDWSVENTVSPANWELFTGDTGTSAFTVSVNKTETDGNWTVSGTISIINNTTSVAVITGVMNEISGQGTLTDACDIEISEANPINLSPGVRLECDYSNSLPDGGDRVLTVMVTTASGGDVLGGTATEDISFGDPTELTGEPGTITVNNSLQDTYGPFSGDDQFTYMKTFSCDADAGSNEDIATINETGDSDDAIVAVNCYGISVETSATTSFTRDWDWTINKTCTPSSVADPIVVALGQIYEVFYNITVDATSTDRDFAVAGEITIYNPNPYRDAELTEVFNAISPDITATIDCGGLIHVPAGGSLTCAYSGNLPDNTTRTNTATATLQNFAFADNGTPSFSGTTDFSGSANISFGDPSTEIDACATITDSNPAFAAIFGDGVGACGQSVFNYVEDVQFSAPDNCGPQILTNMAVVTGDNTGTVYASDNCSIYFDVRCEFGCTLSSGYWKTHNESFFGGASKKADPTWQLVQPNAENSVFFLSGQSWYDVLWTPSQGNVYYILAQVYIAAYLNVNNIEDEITADSSAVGTELAAALALFETFTPAQTAGLNGRNRKEWNDLASTLDNFNNGLIGPGKCDEDDSSAENRTAPYSNFTVDRFSDDQLPTEQYLLEPNWPNPFKSRTTFGFSIPTAEKVQLRVYNINGQLVSTLTDSYLEAGRHEIMWDVPSDVAAGMYFYQIEAGSVLLTRRMLIMK